MDAKKFIQLVEERKKKVLEKKEAPLKWEQKLEAAAKAKAEAEAKVKKNKRHKKTTSSSDNESNTESSDDDRKSSKKRSKKRHKHSHSDSSDDNRKVDKKNMCRSRKRSSNDQSSDDVYDSDCFGRKKRSHKRRHRHHLFRSNFSNITESSSENEGAPVKGQNRQHHKHRRHHQKSSSDEFSQDSGERKFHNKRLLRPCGEGSLSDSDDHRHGSRSLDKLGDDSEEQSGKLRNHKKAHRQHGHHYRRHHHGHQCHKHHLCSEVQYGDPIDHHAGIKG